MFELSKGAATVDALARFDAAVGGLLALDLTRASDDELLDFLRGMETRTRRLAAVDHCGLGEVERRGLAAERACTSTTSFVCQLLRISHSEARARLSAAGTVGPQRGLLGEPLPARFPATADAVAAGTISTVHARIITKTIGALPWTVSDELFDTIEPELVHYAKQFGPDQFTQLARKMADVLDPDGTLRDARHRDWVRDLTIHQRGDGSVSGRFEGTAELGEAMLTVLDKLAAPNPETDGVTDPRTPGQRRHDGMLDALKTLLRSDHLGDCHGVSTTIILTMTAEQARNGDGLARTGHGATIPVRDAITNIGDARLFPVVLGEPINPTELIDPIDPTELTDSGEPDDLTDVANSPPAGIGHHAQGLRPIEQYGTSHRIYTEGQRLAMTARDGGCAFPGCTIGPAWTEAHHMTEWSASKRTSVDDGCLLCGHHHREFERSGWRGEMINAIPHFTAPIWLDPTGTPQRNTAHFVTV